MPTSISRTVGQTFVITPHPLDSGGNPVSLPGHSVTHVSSNEAVAPVTASGVGTARAVGTAVITTTVDGKSDTTTVTVTAASTGTPTLAFTNAPLHLAAAGLIWRTGTATAVHKDGFGVPSGLAVTYSGSDNTVATVDAVTGVVTAVASGMMTATATAGGLTATQVVIVYQNDVCALTEQTGSWEKWHAFYDMQYNATLNSGKLASLDDARTIGRCPQLFGNGSPQPTVTGTGADRRFVTDGTQNFMFGSPNPSYYWDVHDPISLVAGVGMATGTTGKYPVVMGDVNVDYIAIGGPGTARAEITQPLQASPGGDGATAGVPWATGVRRLYIAEKVLVKGLTSEIFVASTVPNRLRGFYENAHQDGASAAVGSRPTGQQQPFLAGAVTVSSGFCAAEYSFIGVRRNEDPMTPSELALLKAFAASRNCVPDTSVTKAFLGIGDSITHGTGTTNPATKNWLAQMMGLSGWTGYDWNDIARDGRTLATMMADMRMKGLYAADPDRTKNIVSVFGATNDVWLYGTPAAELIQMTVSLVAKLSAAGWGTIMLGTMFKRVANNTTQNNITAAFNTQLLALAPTLLSRYGAVVVDWASDARLSDPSNLTYYNADGVHPNDAGSLVMAQLADAALAAYR